MPKGLDTITGFVTFPGATLTAWTMATGDSLTIRNADATKMNLILNAWFFNQSTFTGTSEIRSPRIHDAVHGIRTSILGSDVEPAWAFGSGQKVVPTDTLTVVQSATGDAAGNIETGSLMVYYEDLAGISARLIDTATLLKNTVNLMGVEVDLVAGVAGGYSGAAAINATFDFFKANTDYAVIGMTTTLRQATLTVKGADTGNLRCPVPGEITKRDQTTRWFRLLSDAFGMALIPVFNSQNRPSTFIETVNNQAAASPVVVVILAQVS